jgi:hypothetical protein
MFILVCQRNIYSTRLDFRFTILSMERSHCFMVHPCLVWMFLFLIYGLTDSSPTTTTSFTNVTGKGGIIQLLSTIDPKIRRTLCKDLKENSRPTQRTLTENTSVQASSIPSQKGESCLRSNGATCNTYVRSWSYFYLKVNIYL